MPHYRPSAHRKNLEHSEQCELSSEVKDEADDDIDYHEVTVWLLTIENSITSNMVQN